MNIYLELVFPRCGVTFASAYFEPCMCKCLHPLVAAVALLLEYRCCMRAACDL